MTGSTSFRRLTLIGAAIAVTTGGSLWAVANGGRSTATAPAVARAVTTPR